VPLAFSDSESAQAFDILGRVVTPAALIAAGSRQRSEPLAEPEPARTYAELVGSLANRECTQLLKHVPTLKVTDRFG